jgi:ABC-type sugar transport system substrate-binding protein
LKRRTLKSTIAALGFVVLGSVVAACGSDDSSSTDTSSSGGEQVSVAFLNPAPTTYGQAMDESFDETVKANGATGQRYQANFDPQKQLQQCQDLITKGDVQAIVIYPVDNTTMVPCATQAIDAGIKVTSTDTVIGPKYGETEIQVDGVSGQVVVAPSSDGEAAANLVRKACEGDDDCQVALFVGAPSLAYSAQHTAAVEDQLADDPNINIVGKVTAGLDDPDKGAQAAQDLLTANPDLDVISGDDDSTMQGANTYLQRQNSRVKTIGDGANKAGVAAIESGIQFGTVASMPRTQVKTATEMAIKAVRGEEIPEPSIDYATLSPVGTLELTKDNIADFDPQW